MSLTGRHDETSDRDSDDGDMRMGPTSVCVREFKVPVEFGYAVCCLGPSAVGKTTLVKNLIGKLMINTSIVVFTKADDYTKWTSASNIHHEVTNESLNAIVDHQSHGQSLVLVLDEVFLGNCVKSLESILMLRKSLQITVIITAKSVLNIPPSLRTNIDHWFVKRVVNAAEKQRLWENVFSALPTCGDFNTVLSVICGGAHPMDYQRWRWVGCSNSGQHLSWYEPSAAGRRNRHLETPN